MWPASGWYAGAGLERIDKNRPTSPLFRTVEEAEAESLVVGKYLGDTLAVDLAIGREERSGEVRLVGRF